MKLSIPLFLTLTGSLSTMSSGISIAPPTDSEILAIETEHKKASTGPLKFAEPHKVSVNLCQDGDWSGNTWNLYIESLGAKNLNFGFNNLDLPTGVEMRISSPNKSSNMPEMKVNKSQVHASGQFWTPVLDTDRVNISIEFPTSISVPPPCENVDLGFINVGFRSFSGEGEKSGDCNVDVVCPERLGWEKEIKSVAGVSRNGSLFCTGAMINNMNQDRTPYFLTAYHCGIRDDNAASLVTYWNFETSTCDGNPDGILNQATTGGATVIAGNSQSDVTLLKLNNSPDPSYGVTFAGWDNTPEEYTLPGVCIHHPSGDEKRISFENDDMTSTNYGQSDVDSSFTHIRVADWDVGTTERGSSGSPLFNGNHRIIGQLHGGYAACGNDRADWYGRFSVSWENTPNLSQALDPDDILDGAFGGVDTYVMSPTISPAPTGTPTEPVPTVSPTECDQSSFSLQLQLDGYGSETKWSLLNEGTNNTVLSGGPYENNALIEVDECINTGCYEFEILDAYGDGICCTYGDGYYTITFDGDVVKDPNGEYGGADYVNFCTSTLTNPPNSPAATPTTIPTATPTEIPTATPTKITPTDPPNSPAVTPTTIPTATPTKIPTATPTKIPTATPTKIPTATPTKIPTATPTTFTTTNDECIPATSNCFTKHQKAACSDKSCEVKVCEEKKPCCNKKWFRSCVNIALELCTPSCECKESPEALFFLKKKNGKAKTKSCEWLKGKNKNARKGICKNKTHSSGDFQAPRVVCPLTCELEACL